MYVGNMFTDCCKENVTKYKLSRSLYRASVLPLHTAIPSELSDVVHHTPCDETDQCICIVMANGQQRSCPYISIGKSALNVNDLLQTVPSVLRVARFSDFVYRLLFRKEHHS
jgi:hypothetical protein